MFGYKFAQRAAVYNSVKKGTRRFHDDKEPPERNLISGLGILLGIGLVEGIDFCLKHLSFGPKTKELTQSQDLPDQRSNGPKL